MNTGMSTRMSTPLAVGMLRVAAVADSFDRDLEAGFAKVEALAARAAGRGVRLLALPEAALGGYLLDLEGAAEPAPALHVDGPEIARVAAIAGRHGLVLTVGFTEEAADGTIFNACVCVSGDGVLGHHRKVHQPLREDRAFAAGDEFRAFDTPVGRLGMMICYDKAFPESARDLALDGAEVIVVMSAWPGSRTGASADLREDRWKLRFDIFDQARALENQVVWVSANQSGTFGSMRFVASAKVVGPGGDVLADTGVEDGMAIADIDVGEALATARRSMGHLRDRRPETYRAAAAQAPVPASVHAPVLAPAPVTAPVTAPVSGPVPGPVAAWR